MERQGFGIRGSGFGALLGLGLVVMFNARAFAAARSRGERELGITVHVYNYARVPRGILVRAEKQVTRAFRETGLEMGWCNIMIGSAESRMEPSCNQPAGRPPLELRIVPRLTAMPGKTSDSTMGFAVGNVATVSFERVVHTVPTDVAMPSEILACAIAHEIGHVLLGPSSHSRTGIMAGVWRPEEFLQGAAWGRLLFTPQQAEIIRAAARRFHTFATYNSSRRGETGACRPSL